MRFTLCSSPLSGQNTTLGLQIPHRSGWPRKHRRPREANPLRTWCQPNSTTSEMSSPRKPLTSSHCGRHGTMPLISHLGLNSLTPGCSPCPLQNRRSLMTLPPGEPCKQLIPSIQVPHGSPCVLCQEEGWFTSPHTGLLEVEQDHGQELLPPPPHLRCPNLPP